MTSESSNNGRGGNAPHWRWFKRLMLWTFLLSLVVVAIAIVWWLSTDTPLGITAIIAMSLGIILSLMLGAGLMGLVFVSARSGIDDGVIDLPEDDRGESR